MGRPKRKIGLDYFPFDIDLFYDIKVRKLVKYQSGKAITVYTFLLSCIYKNGYYMLWDKEMPYVCSEMTGFEEAYISEVLKSCLSVGLFDKELFEKHGVLTSAGIQTRYQRIVSQTTKRHCTLREYSLIDDSDEDQQPPRQDPPKPKAKAKEKEKPQAVHIDEPLPDDDTPPPVADEPSLNLDQEISELKEDTEWLEPVCMRFRLLMPEVTQRLDQFAVHCRTIEHTHTSIRAAKQHFVAWLAKQPKPKINSPTPTPPPAPAIPEPVDFGGVDY
jgi:hypothetical protein